MTTKLRNFILVTLTALGCLFVYTHSMASSQPDYPHNPAQGVNCYDCHSFWSIFDPGATGDDLCLDCHDGILTHSSANTSNGNVEWEIQCKTCHMPHFQEQFRTFGDESYLFSGTSDQDGITSTTLTSSASRWVSDELAGLILIPNVLKDSYNFKIITNTADTITVSGPIDVEKVAGIDGDPTDFAVVYGKLIRGSIETPNSGTREVRFFNSTGENSFAGDDNVWDGICEVCHTETDHFQNDGDADDQLHENYGDKSGTNCIVCHSHGDGFAGGRPAPPHDTQAFLADCYLCHLNGMPYAEPVPDSQCNQCHTEAGSLRGSGFDAAPLVLTHDAVHGSSGFTYSYGCLECHTLMGAPTNLKLVSSRVAGSAIADSNIVYTSRFNAGSMADGMPHESNICETCHQITNHHLFDGSAMADYKQGVYVGHYDGKDCMACHPHNNAFVFEGSDVCDNCHGNPPVTTSIGGPNGLIGLWEPSGSTTAGRHAKHAGALPGGYGYDCSACHSDGMDLANLELDESIQVGFDVFGFSGAGSTYDHQVLNLPYTVSGTNGSSVTPGNSMICNNFYCHSDGTAVSTRAADPTTFPGPAKATPPWNSSSSLACNSCHGYAPAYPDRNPKSNAHARHMGLFNWAGSPNEDPNPCHICHYSTTTNGFTITNKANHVNGQYDVVANPYAIFIVNTQNQYPVSFTYTYKTSRSTCTNISCHSMISENHTWGW